MERLVEIPGFPDYEISDHGNVYSKKNGRNLALSRNVGGIVKVNLYNENGMHTRAVRTLVANAFVGIEHGVIVEIPEDVVIDTHRVVDRRVNARSNELEVINLDGNQENNHYLNLAWRPHWFAWRYTRQFKFEPPIEFVKPEIIDTVTGILYPNAVEAGIADGVLWEFVYNSALSGRPVYPTGAIYQLAYQVQSHR